MVKPLGAISLLSKPTESNSSSITLSFIKMLSSMNFFIFTGDFFIDTSSKTLRFDGEKQTARTTSLSVLGNQNSSLSALVQVVKRFE